MMIFIILTIFCARILGSKSIDVEKQHLQQESSLSSEHDAESDVGAGAAAISVMNTINYVEKDVCFADGTKQNHEHCDTRKKPGCRVCKYGHYYFWFAHYCCPPNIHGKVSSNCDCYASEDELAAGVSSTESLKLASGNSLSSEHDAESDVGAGAATMHVFNSIAYEEKDVCFADGTKQNHEHCDTRKKPGCNVCKYGHYYYWFAHYCCPPNIHGKVSVDCDCYASEDELAVGVSSIGNNILESTGTQRFVVMFAFVGVAALMVTGAKLIHKRACASNEFQQIFDAPEI